MTLVTRMAANSVKVIKEKHRRKHQTAAHALKASLRQAAAQQRLAVGLRSCVNKLKKNPDSVMACLLLQGRRKDPDRASSNIQHTLLQAFCTENRISLVRVQADAALMHLVRQIAGRVKDSEETGTCHVQEGPPVDCSLLLIEYPEGLPSQEDEVWIAASQGGQLDILTIGHLPSD